MTGTVILIIGIALLPVAAADVVESFGPADMAGEPVYRLIEGNYIAKDAIDLKNIAYALGTLGLIVMIQRFFKGFLQTIAGTWDRLWPAPRATRSAWARSTR